MTLNATDDQSTQNGSDGVSASPSELEEPTFPYGGFTGAELGIIAGVCILLALITFLSSLNSPCCAPETQVETFRSMGRRLLNVSLWGLLALPTFWACVHLRPRSLGWTATIGGHALLAMSIPFVAEMGSHAINVAMITLLPPPDPPDSMAFPFREVLVNLEFLNELAPYLILLVVGLGRERYLRSRARQEQAEQLEREAEQLRAKLTAARLESLRMQINPHFFHNTLHTISTMAGRDPDGIRTATARLSDLMRYVLSTSDRQEVALEEELDVLESYLDIQKLRLGDRLDVTTDVDPAVRMALVPTLLLQPLAENAVKHGFEGTDEPGHLYVGATREGDELVLVVADDGGGLPDEGSVPADGFASQGDGTNEGYGLSNIAERLHGLYGEAASLQFEESDGGGLRVTIRFPYRPRDEQQNLRATGVVAE